MSEGKSCVGVPRPSGVVAAAAVWVIALGCFQLVGCGGGDRATDTGDSAGSQSVTTRIVNTPPASDKKAAVGSSAQTTALLRAKLKFKDASGQTAFSIKPQSNGAKLVDGQERELGRFSLKGSKLKIKDANDTVLGYVNASAGKYKVKSADGKTDLWDLQRQSGGGWKLQDAQDQMVYRIKKRDYGFEIEDVANNSLFKVKLKSGKTSLRDSSEQTVYSTRDQVSAIAVTCLGLTAIDSLPLKAALLTMLANETGQ